VLVTRYTYKSDVEIPLTDNEVDRKSNGRVFLNSDGTKTNRIYARNVYAEENGKWYEVHTATTTPEIFEKETTSLIISLVKKVHAQVFLNQPLEALI